MRVVVDTNVLLSGLLNPAGPPGRIMDLLRAGALNLVVEDRILAEYENVLCRSRFDSLIATTARERFLTFVRSESTRVACRVVVPGMPHTGDTPFLETALSEGVPLVTGNLRHFPERLRRGCEVLTPKEFVERLAEELGRGDQ